MVCEGIFIGVVSDISFSGDSLGNEVDFGRCSWIYHVDEILDSTNVLQDAHVWPHERGYVGLDYNAVHLPGAEVSQGAGLGYQNEHGCLLHAKQP